MPTHMYVVWSAWRGDEQHTADAASPVQEPPFSTGPFFNHAPHEDAPVSGRWEEHFDVMEIQGMLRLLHHVDLRERRAYTRYLLALASKLPQLHGHFTLTRNGVAMQPKDDVMITRQ